MKHQQPTEREQISQKTDYTCKEVRAGTWSRVCDGNAGFVKRPKSDLEPRTIFAG